MATKTFDVVAAGVAAVDDLLYVEQYPAANVKMAIQRSARHPGGLATTAAAAVARLGGRAAYAGRFDQSDLSHFMMGTMAQHGVDVSHVVREDATDGAQPYHSTIIVDAAGTRTILYDCSKFRGLVAAELAEDLIRSAGVFLLDYINDPPVLDLAGKIRGLGVPILGDIEGRSASALKMLPLMDHLIVSEDFARWATGKEDLREACAGLANAGRASTVVTAGAEGAYLCDGQAAPIHVPAFRVEAVDTTGCGDTFHGAYALGIAREFSPPEATVLASAAAAIKATGRAAWGSIPTAAEVGEFLKKRLAGTPQDQQVLRQIANLAKKT